MPFRKATSCAIHVSGGEFNCTANLADCFGTRTAIATAMVDYPLGELVQALVAELHLDLAVARQDELRAQLSLSALIAAG